VRDPVRDPAPARSGLAPARKTEIPVGVATAGETSPGLTQLEVPEDQHRVAVVGGGSRSGVPGAQCPDV
jgi:hypothetical protein